ncbi:MAG: hypothetical protein HZB39_10755 [Planctomycetes bacterium]|nr:hypothetical protein [Planctomycetota bacterium]
MSTTANNHQHERDEPLAERDALMMAYVDDELAPEARMRFEAMMAGDPDLAAEVADHRAMLDLGRAAVALEPTERELRRFWSRFHNRAEWRLGWSLFLAGLAVLAGFCVYEICIAERFPLLVKAAALCTIAGAAILLASVFRQRRIQARLDRYRGIVR